MGAAVQTNEGLNRGAAASGLYAPFCRGHALLHERKYALVRVVYLCNAVARRGEVAEKSQQATRFIAGSEHIDVGASVLQAIVMLIKVIPM